MEKLPKGPYNESLYYHSKKCIICLNCFKDKEEVLYLPCDPRHHFHSLCIESWLNKALRCPICNISLTFETIENCKNYEELIEFVKEKDEESFISSRKTSANEHS